MLFDRVEKPLAVMVRGFLVPVIRISIGCERREAISSYREMALPAGVGSQ